MRNSAIDRRKTPTSLSEWLKQHKWTRVRSDVTNRVILRRPDGNRNEIFYVFDRLRQPYIVVDGIKVIVD